MKENWTYKKLGEVVDILNGYAFKSSNYVDKGIRVIRIANVQKGLIEDKEPAYYPLTTEAELSRYMLRADDILMSLTGNVGRVGLLPKEMLPAALNQRVACIRLISKNLDFKLLYHYLNSDLFENKCIASSRGIAQLNMSTEWLKEQLIPVPSMDEQQSIVQELDAINEVLSKKREQLKELDKLAQSIFYDMFGDPVTNEKGWEVKKLGEVCSKIGSGATPKGGEQSYISQGISLIRSLNVHNAEFIYKELAHIDEKQARALSNVTIEIDDLLLNITGASVARCCIVPNNILPARVNQHVCILRCKSTINYRFLLYTIISNSYQQYLWRQARSKAATREALPKTIVDNLPIPLPPLPLQQTFAEKIEKIEQMKQNLKASIHETETLLASRMSYWFE